MPQQERRRLDLRLEKVVAGQRILLEQIARSVPLPVVLEQLVLLVEGYASEGAMGCVHVVDAGGRLRVAAAPHLPAAYRDAVDGYGVRDLTTGQTRPSPFLRGTVVSSDISLDPGWDTVREIALKSGLRSCWTTPLVAADELLGTFALYFGHRRDPDRQDRAVAEMIARTAVLAIDRDRVEQARATSRSDEAAAREDLQFVLDATTALARSLDRDRTVAMLAELAVPRLAPLAVVDLVVDGTIVRAAVATAPDVPDEVRASVAEHDPRPDSDHPAVRVLADGTEEVVLGRSGWMPGDVRGDADHVEALEHLEVTGYASFPLTARGTTFGVLSITSTSPSPLGARSIGLARELADRGALAIDNADQHVRQGVVAAELAEVNTRLREAVEAQRLVALSLQHAMLPAPPRTVPGLEVAVRYRPADDGLAIGGDWYDVLAEDDGTVSVAVGDVVGKGLDAAGVMGQLRSALRTATWSVDGPAAALRVVDQYARTLDGALATTVVAVHLDLGARTLRYASAGHPPPLVVEADGATRFLADATRAPLGVDGGGEFVEAGSPFAAGSTLVLYSDGLVERRDRDIDAGLDWLAETVSRVRERPVEELADLVLDAARAGVSAADDTVVVVLRSPRCEGATDPGR